MSRYQRKPILVEAIQFTGANISDIAYNFNMVDGEDYEITPGGDIALKTAGQFNIFLKPGDWVMYHIDDDEFRIHSTEEINSLYDYLGE